MYGVGISGDKDCFLSSYLRILQDAGQSYSNDSTQHKPKPYLGMQKPIVLSLLSVTLKNIRVITYYYIGFGVAGAALML